MAIHGKLNIEHEFMTIGSKERDQNHWSTGVRSGPWALEPFDFGCWVDAQTGYTCAIKRNVVGAWCGYVFAPEDHPVHFRDEGMDEYQRNLTSGNPVWLECHGGVTYHGTMDLPDGLVSGLAIGFDCSHLADLSPRDTVKGPACGDYATASYAIGEVRKLAKQIHEYRPLQQMVG
jgi:hypothetical protein